MNNLENSLNAVADEMAIVARTAPRYLRNELLIFLNEQRLRLLELRIRFCNARITCLKRGYSPADKGDLAMHVVFLGASVIKHPVKALMVFLKCWSNLRSNDWEPMTSSAEKTDIAN